MRATQPSFSSGQLDRLRYIEFRLMFAGQIRRLDVMKRFQVAEAAATRDLAAYRDAAPANLVYDQALKIYVVADSFERFFLKSIQAKDLLRALVHGMGDDFGASGEPLIPCELPTRLHAPNIQVVASVSRAIYAGCGLQITYYSLSSGKTSRVILPFSLAGNGMRWHVRAFDRANNGFRDFVINRIETAVIAPQERPAAHETKDNDIQWNRIVELELAPHPKLKSKKFVEVEHGMNGGLLRHRVRAALAGYILRLWNVDCTSDASLNGPEYHLWLHNREALYGVEKMDIAPGYRLQPMK